MISVVIPSIENHDFLEERLPLILNRISSPNQTEMILVDSRNLALNRVLCEGLGVRYLSTSRSQRAFQMNRGADIATGSTILFLHADSIPPLGFDETIRKKMSEGYSSGCFRLKFFPDHGFLRFWAWFTRFNYPICRGGDQGIFMEKDLFESLSGYDESLPIMEDLDMCRKLYRYGRFSVIKDQIQTSSRKYFSIGIYRLQFLFIAFSLAYWFGMDPAHIHRYYRKRISMEGNEAIEN